MSREAFKHVEMYTRLPRPFLPILHRRTAMHVRATPTLPPVVRVAAKLVARRAGIPKASFGEYIRKKTTDEYLSKTLKTKLRISMSGAILTFISRFHSPNRPGDKSTFMLWRIFYLPFQDPPHVRLHAWVVFRFDGKIR